MRTPHSAYLFHRIKFCFRIFYLFAEKRDLFFSAKIALPLFSSAYKTVAFDVSFIHGLCSIHTRPQLPSPVLFPLPTGLLHLSTCCSRVSCCFSVLQMKHWELSLESMTLLLESPQFSAPSYNERNSSVQ